MSSNTTLALLEKEILDFWREDDTFKKSLINKEGEFVFYDGPPFANGLPHYGHLLTGFVKDAVGRYQTMKGKSVRRCFGWDCHGLPAEMGAEKELKISGRAQIEEFGIAKFNEHCRDSVMRYASQWRKYVNRQARWVDFDNDYRTMDKNFMESVIWAFKQLYSQGLIYEDYRVMPYSWACETPLSNFEIRIDNAYRQKSSKAVTIAFELEKTPDWILSSHPFVKKCKILAWTTTPWTLPSNLALAIGSEMQYSYVIFDSICYIMSHICIRQYLPEIMSKNPAANNGKFIFGQLAQDHLQKFIDLRRQQSKENQEQLRNDEDLFVQLLEQQHWAILDKESSELIGYISYADDGLHKVAKPASCFNYVLCDTQRFYAKEILISWLEWAFCNLKIESLTCESEFLEELDGIKDICGINDANKNQIISKDFYHARSFAGHKLLGYKYRPLFPYFKDTKNAFTIIEGDFLSEEEGTGVVHSAPGFGEEDFILCKKHEIPIVCPVDDKGRFTDEVKDFRDMHVFDTNDLIIRMLKEQDSWIKTEQYIHNYPHCWRTDTPLIYKAISSWCVKVTTLKERMVALNKKINWIPEHIKLGQFGKWLESARDWSISRNRFWGTPIPIWKSDNPEYPRMDVYGSIAELEQDFNVKIDDLHRPFIDHLTRPNPDDPTGKSMMRRVTEVLDCWFESGSMPHAEVHYPFNQDSYENKLGDDEDKLRKNFNPVLYPPKRLPADFIVEYVAQTRGWFYTLFVLSVALFDRIPFKNCICHGVILDESGQKLSKRLNNYTDPIEIMEQYGSDSLRFLMLSGSVMNGGDMLIDKECEAVKDISRLVINPIWNACCFLTRYAELHEIKDMLHNIDVVDEQNVSFMDYYILMKCMKMVAEVDSGFANYKIQDCCKAFREFIGILNNWYIRRNRDRFVTNKDLRAYNILHTLLHYTALAISPLLPIVAEAIYQNLNNSNKISVHLQSFPANEKFSKYLKNLSIRGFRGIELLSAMDKIRAICNAALAIRNNKQIRIRQPLQKLSIVYQEDNGFSQIIQIDEMLDALRDEVNVKKVEIVLEDWSKYAHLVPKVNFPLLAKRLSHKIKEINTQIRRNNWNMENGQVFVCDEFLTKDECELVLEPLDKTNCVALEDFVVLLDLNVDENLRLEGITRDLIRFIQETRKQAGFQINNEINLIIVSDFDCLLSAVDKWRDDIKNSTSVRDIKINVPHTDYFICEYEIEKHRIKVGVHRAL